MNRAAAIALIGAMLAGSALGQPYYIELDLDNVQGNGPDVGSIGFNDLIEVDCWIMGNTVGWNQIIHAQITICNPDESLELVEYVNQTGFNSPPPVDVGDGCYLFSSTSFDMGLTAPYLYGFLTFQANSDNTVAAILSDIDPTASLWMGTNFNTGYFEPGVGANLMIGNTAIESSSWGTVKKLFQ